MNMMKPLNDNVLVERIERDSVSKGGIIIPDTAKEKPAQGIVVAVGPGKRDKAGKHIEIDAKCGEKVLFGKYSGTEVKLNGKEYVILRADDILAVFED
ncbi:MAG: co-chaperone GroES [Bradymonadales bacterium]|nr:co-chaperone GroES [Bradymonadales bacterium]